MITGWERERRQHFDEVVGDYDRVRPEYPCELFDDIFRYIGTGPAKKHLRSVPEQGRQLYIS